MVEKSVLVFEEEPDVFPYLEIDGKLAPVTLHSIREINELISKGDKRQLLIANDESIGEGEVVVSFLDPNLKLKPGQGFNSKGIIWQETRAHPSSI